MTKLDDRADFMRNSKSQALKLGKDTKVFEQAKETMLALNQYDYPYLWNWLGMPIIQIPADIIATQEAIWTTKPDVIIETGVARGGSVVFLASILALLGGVGFVIGIDIDIRAHNRDAINSHSLSSRIKLVEGDSTAKGTIAEVSGMIPQNARVMVILDSDHTRDHVLAELRSYGQLVSKGCYMVVADTFAGFLSEDEAPRNRSKHIFRGNDPLSARDAFLAETDRFEIDETINGKLVLSSSPGGYLMCIKQ
ncbi:MAG: CmcI family methyltransferase [Albidovulum sp.]|nr:CmcI family methyltransferase [Albidovulum sp.]